MSNPEITLELHKNIIGDLPGRLTAYASKLDSQPRAKEAVLACSGVIAGWLTQKTERVRCTRSLTSWEWLLETCIVMKAQAAALVLETKLEQWRRAQEDVEQAKLLRAEREAFVARGEEA